MTTATMTRRKEIAEAIRNRTEEIAIETVPSLGLRQSDPILRGFLGEEIGRLLTRVPVDDWAWMISTGPAEVSREIRMVDEISTFFASIAVGRIATTFENWKAEWGRTMTGLDDGIETTEDFALMEARTGRDW